MQDGGTGEPKNSDYGLRPVRSRRCRAKKNRVERPFTGGTTSERAKVASYKFEDFDGAFRYFFQMFLID